MNGFDWQNLVALSVVMIAIAYLGFRVRAMFMRRSSGCGGGCASCPAQSSDESNQLVTIVPSEQLAASARAVR